MHSKSGRLPPKAVELTCLGLIGNCKIVLQLADAVALFQGCWKYRPLKTVQAHSCTKAHIVLDKLFVEHVHSK